MLNIPGDIRVDAESEKAKKQPLGKQEEELLKRMYKLYQHFHEKLRPVHEEMVHAREMREFCQPEQAETSPPTNTLGSCMDNAEADQIDNMPEAKLLPEREETAQSAEEMEDVVSFVLEQAGWEETYHVLMEDAVVTGTGIAQIFWDENAMNGEGMVNIIPWHPEDFYPDPMYENIQDGRGCFKVTHTTVAWVESHYPEQAGFIRADEGERQNQCEADVFEAPDGDEATTLIEFWYKKYDPKTKRNHVHMAQAAGKALLLSTELDYGTPEKGAYKDGVYAHGEYPFVLFKHRDVFRKPFGTGMVHDYGTTQNAIDRYFKYIDDNARASSCPRHFIRDSADVNVEDVCDLSKKVIEWKGSDAREVIQTITTPPLNGQVFQAMTYLGDSMKQDSGQNQFARGEGGMGVTSAAGIQALQEAGGKISRMHTGRYKFAFKRMVIHILWILAEYLEPSRKMRIVGGWDSSGNMKERIIEVNAPAASGDKLPKPAYTVRVQVQKNNPLQIQIDNEFLAQVAQICQAAGQPLPPEAIISMMEGYRTKSSVLKKVQENSSEIAEKNAIIQERDKAVEERDAERQVNAGIQEAMTSKGAGYGLTRKIDEEAAI